MSSVAGLKLLHTAIKEGSYAPAYLFFGEEDYRKQDALEQLIAAAVDPATRDFNLEIRRGGDTDAQTLGSLLNTPPMMADRRMVVVRDVGALKKDARTALDKYLKAPAHDTILVLVIPAGGKDDKALQDRTTPVEFESLAGDKLTKWITQQAQTLGVTITPEAVGLLHESVGSELGQLSVELEKLGNYTGGQPIDEAAVTAIVGVRRGETQSDLVRAIVRRDAQRSLELLPVVLDQPKAAGVLIVMALGTHMLGLSFARARVDRGARPASLKNDLFGFLKGGSTYPSMSWGDATDLWMASVDRWSAAELGDALGVVLAADRALKESRVSSEIQTLVSLILALCTPAPARGAA